MLKKVKNCIPDDLYLYDKDCWICKNSINAIKKGLTKNQIIVINPDMAHNYHICIFTSKNLNDCKGFKNWETEGI